MGDDAISSRRAYYAEPPAPGRGGKDSNPSVLNSWMTRRTSLSSLGTSRVRYLLGSLDLAADRLWGHLVERKDGPSVPIRILENRRKVA
jgi:hypothetical protein